MSQAIVVLRPLTRRDLPAVTPWFEDPDTRRFLGGRQWPAAMLAHGDRSVGTTFRGARQTGCDRYLALAGGTPVGYIDCGTFDRCTVYGGEGPEGPIITDSTDVATGSIAFVVDPAVRRGVPGPRDDQCADAPAGAPLRGTVRGWRGAREHRISSVP